MRHGSPPRLARTILEWLLPASVEAEFLIGDLDEEYRGTILQKHSFLRARLWYWRQVLTTLGASWPPLSKSKLPTNHRWRPTPMGDLLREITYGARTLIRNRAITTVAVLTLAIGIGANTAIFSVIQTVILNPLPYPESDRIVRIYEGHERFLEEAGEHGLFTPMTFAAFRDLHNSVDGLQSSGAYRDWLFNVTGEESPERVTGALVSRGLLETIGVNPQKGRLFDESEYAGGSPSVILSHQMWTRRYGADPEIIGKPIVLNDTSATIIGVLPRNKGYPSGAQLWATLRDGSSLWSNRSAHLLNMVGRLADGASLEQVSSELQILGSNIDEANAGIDPDPVFSVATQHDRLTANIREPLYVLLGAVGCILLIACVNVANLLSAQASGRSRQISIRAALGATRLRIIRQLLLESGLLALVAGTVGLGLAYGIVIAIQATAPSGIPRIQSLAPDWNMALVSFGVSALTIFVFGLLPAITTSTPDLAQSLKESHRTSPGLRAGRLRGLLVVAEVALAILLLVGAGLLVNSFARLLEEDPGFEADGLLAFQLYLSPGRFQEGGRAVAQHRYLTEMLDSIRSVSGVEGAGLVNVAPLAGGPATGFYLTDEGKPAAGAGPLAETRVVDPEYFEVMKMPLLAGRGFTAHDDATSTPVMVVSQEFANRHLGGLSGVGRQVTMTGWGPPRVAEVIGIVGDIKVSSLEETYRPAMYWHYPQFPQIFNTMVVRTATQPRSVLPTIRERVWDINPDQTLAAVRTMEEALSGVTAQRRLVLTLLGCFSATALILAIVGLYGVLAYNVSLRTSEMGLRRALGATGGQLLGMVVRQGVWLCGAGIGLGLVGALGLSRFLAAQLFGVSATDAPTYVLIALLMLVVSATASVIPARRAARIDPLKALREET